MPPRALTTVYKSVHALVILRLLIHGAVLLLWALPLPSGWLDYGKGPCTDLGSYENNHASSFSMVHQLRKRRLRVSVERDMGGTTAAPKP
ncbi:hypothetical protein HAX54_045895 [Datura stramonium]|uniref:Uncharacterized protein n=1 Tax=Datura stramonium TaxID=4076 RepID=A0ABS8SR67_DATST|nr:hypothetical protein [Datura stramonium]